VNLVASTLRQSAPGEPCESVARILGLGGPAEVGADHVSDVLNGHPPLSAHGVSSSLQAAPAVLRRRESRRALGRPGEDESGPSSRRFSAAEKARSCLRFLFTHTAHLVRGRRADRATGPGRSGRPR